MIYCNKLKKSYCFLPLTSKYNKYYIISCSAWSSSSHVWFVYIKIELSLLFCLTFYSFTVLSLPSLPSVYLFHPKKKRRRKIKQKINVWRVKCWRLRLNKKKNCYIRWRGYMYNKCVFLYICVNFTQLYYNDMSKKKKKTK